MSSNDTIGSCIKETGNWSKLSGVHKFDNKDFDEEVVLKDMKAAAPKLMRLLENIKELDERDLKDHGKLFKHFIYSDIKSSYGAKLVASGLSAFGFEHAYAVVKTPRGLSFQVTPSVINKKNGNAFATLTSVSFFEKPIGVNFRKDLLRIYNSRPDNVQGEKIRIIILDSGFREGVDLFDVKYAHIFEPISTIADEKQAIGRVTRYCGQKGLVFHPSEGWPVQVFRYETVLPKHIRKILHVQSPALLPAETFHEIFLKFSNLDPKKLNLANELESVSIQGAVDHELTKNVHEFKVGEKMSGGEGSGASAGKKHAEFQQAIGKKYKHYAWPPIKIENGCTVPPPKVGDGVGGPSILPFTPTQDFIRHYFTPTSKTHGMLLWHSVGTGKTCTAIATASSSFERMGYSIIYVTRHTLKGDVWKNMFDQVCSTILQERIHKGLKLPEAQAQRTRLLEGKWLEPMSYKQFSNMIEGKSRLSQDLKARNGALDPLKKTLVIIDEAHKLFASDVTGAEKPNVEAIQKAFFNSYEKSGKDGVRMLFMTATPYTSDPVDLLRLLNLLRPPTKQLPDTFESFSSVYLDTDGHFTVEGKKRYHDDITGIISYLNREKDIRTFSYAVHRDVKVPMSDYEFLTSMNDYTYHRDVVKGAQGDLNNNKAIMAQDIANKQASNAKDLEDITKRHEKALKECVEQKGKSNKDREKEASEKLRKETKECYEKEAKCIDNIRKMYKDSMKVLRDAAKAQLAECGNDATCKASVQEKLELNIEEQKSDMAFDINECKTNAEQVECYNQAKTQHKTIMDAIKNKVSCEDLKVQQVQERKAIVERHNNELKALRERLMETIRIDEMLLERHTSNLKVLHDTFKSNVLVDKSQRLRLEQCLNLLPAYKRIVNGDKKLIDIEIETAPLLTEEEAEETAKELGNFGNNVFLVSGHGSETVENFKGRFRMPKGKILIVFPVCARPNFMGSACDFFDMFNDPKRKKMLEDPLRNRNKITSLLNHPIRMYLPGERVPNLTTNLFLNYEKTETTIVKSGVYRIGNFPKVNRTRLPLSDDFRAHVGPCTDYYGMIKSPNYYNSAIHHEVFRGNVFQPVKTKELYSSMVHKSFKLEDIMKEVGPGVYYYIGCRSSHEQVRPDMYARVMQASDSQQHATDRSRRIKELDDWLKVRGSRNTFLNKTPSIVTATPESSNVKTPVKPDEKKDVPKVDSKERRKQERKEKDNNDEERAQIKLIHSQITTGEEEVIRDIKNARLLSAKIMEWNEAVIRMKSTPRTKALLKAIQVLEYLIENFDQGEVDFVVKDTKMTVNGQQLPFKILLRSIVFNIPEPRAKRAFEGQIIGCIPNGLKNIDMKCSSSNVTKRVVKILRSNMAIELPTDPEEWYKGNVNEKFERLCTTSKTLWKSIR